MIGNCDVCSRQGELSRSVISGLETWACGKCRGAPEEDTWAMLEQVENNPAHMDLLRAFLTDFARPSVLRDLFETIEDVGMERGPFTEMIDQIHKELTGSTIDQFWQNFHDINSNTLSQP